MCSVLTKEHAITLMYTNLTFKLAHVTGIWNKLIHTFLNRKHYLNECDNKITVNLPFSNIFSANGNNMKKKYTSPPVSNKNSTWRHCHFSADKCGQCPHLTLPSPTQGQELLSVLLGEEFAKQTLAQKPELLPGHA